MLFNSAQLSCTKCHRVGPEGEQFGVDFLVVIFRAKPLVFPYDGFHAQQVDDAFEIVLRADRQLNADRTAADFGPDLFDLMRIQTSPMDGDGARFQLG